MLSRSVVSDSATPWTAAHQAPWSMGVLQARILECVVMPSTRGSSQPRGQTQVFHTEPPGKPKNTRVGSLSLLQGIFPNPGIKPGPLALQVDSLPAEPRDYQLSDQGSPDKRKSEKERQITYDTIYM